MIKNIRKKLASLCRESATKLMTWAARMDGATGGYNFSYHNEYGVFQLTRDSCALTNWKHTNEEFEGGLGMWRPSECGEGGVCKIVDLEGPE